MINKSVKLPRFARDFFNQRVRCRHCRQKLVEANVTFVGAGRDKDGSICFSYEAKCPRCEEINTIIDTTRQFTESDWWEELGRWHQQALDEMGPYCRFPQHDKGIARLLIAPTDRIPMRTLHILKGCKGDAGPVLLSFWNPASTIYGRLERHDHLLMFPSSLFCEEFTTHGWVKLNATGEGETFTHDGRTWTRLTRDEIQEIVRDRVFTLIQPTTQEFPKKRRKARSKSTQQARGPHENAHAQESGKGARRASRNAGKVDSRRRRPEGLH